MPSQKRPIEAVEDGPRHIVPPLLSRIRNMWQFANLCQWIYIFGKAAKIDESVDIEDIEVECLKPNSTTLADIALALLKLVSSHRGLTHDIFDHQARKQYLARSSSCNPFGDESAPQQFADFDIFTKIKVMQQFTQWIMVHPERIRDRMEEQKDTEQTEWRIEPYGWDSQDRTYYVLDDNRVYRLSEPPVSAASHRISKSKSSGAGRRSSKRQRIALSTDTHPNGQDADMSDNEGNSRLDSEGLGGMGWECIAVTLEDVRGLLGELAKTRDENEKILRKQLEIHLVPILEKQEEARKRRELQRERELLNLAKLANAKRSSRIASKIEQQKQEDRARAEKLQLEEAEATKRREEQVHLKLERERDVRLASREKRLKDRETRRLRHEEQLVQLSTNRASTDDQTGRMSHRHLQAEIEKNKQALKDIEQEEEAWIFDCLCGMYGQVDDGTHSVACERCNVWQHSKCLGISETMADRPDFQFICSSCRLQKEDGSTTPKHHIKLKLRHAGSPTTSSRSVETSVEGNQSPHDAGNGNIAETLSPLLSAPEPLKPVDIGQDIEAPLTAIDIQKAPTPSGSSAISTARGGDASLEHTSLTVNDAKSDEPSVGEVSSGGLGDEGASNEVPGADSELTHYPTGNDITSKKQERTKIEKYDLHGCGQAIESLQGSSHMGCTTSHITYVPR